jgi:enamine deaminase RidA (YjgF/YER057c/UK114 family)
MERPVASPHEIRNPDTLPPAQGFSHAVIAQAGRTVYLAGQTAQQADGTIVEGSIAEQFDVAAGNVVKALEAAGAHPQDLVSIQIFVTNVAEYQRLGNEVGEAYRRHFGIHYPAMAVLEVSRLWDSKALVELMAIAVTA